MHIVTENWIKPPKIVQYKTAKFISFNNNILICSFYFPEKYFNNDFYINNKKVLSKGDMYIGKRYFYPDRFYSLLEYYSFDNKLKAYYFDIVLPPIINIDYVYILDIKIDFFVLDNKKDFFILDEDELNDAINKKLYSKEEIEICNNTKLFFEDKLKNNNFDQIFSQYKKSNYKEWDRYKNIALTYT